jgi:hypothetical protein
MSRIRLFAAVAGAAVLLLAGGSAVADSPDSFGSGCLTGAITEVAFVAPAESKLSRNLAPALVPDSIELKDALDCVVPAEKPAHVPVVSGEVEQPAWLIKEMSGGPPHCSVV